jgi:hypothetical protein
MNGRSIKCRNWCFTLNNPVIEPQEYVDSIVAMGCRYCIVGVEVGESGTRHFQGVVVFTNQRAFSGVQKQLQGAHIEAMRGTLEQAITYCEKDGDVYEAGERPMSKSEQGKAGAEVYRKVIDLARQGNCNEIVEYAPAIYLQHYASIQRIREANLQEVKDLEKPCGIWLVGPSGAGKSHLVRNIRMRVYDKLFNKWWDGYQAQPIALLDDADPRNTEKLQDFLKRWTDQYGFHAEIKGGSRKLRPQFVVITSQYTIKECFEDANTRDAMSRRCRVIEVAQGNRSCAKLAIQSAIAAMGGQSLLEWCKGDEQNSGFTDYSSWQSEGATHSDSCNACAQEFEWFTECASEEQALEAATNLLSGDATD